MHVCTKHKRIQNWKLTSDALVAFSFSYWMSKKHGGGRWDSSNASQFKMLHCKKKLAISPSLAIIPGQGELVTSRLGTGKSLNFLQCNVRQKISVKKKCYQRTLCVILQKAQTSEIDPLFICVENVMFISIRTLGLA
jgi:hypothetical protein